ncbi:CCA tRNA nucleotidyltransferase [Pseudoruegeria sp. SHC-113]|uniref:CCA tRNA nucleotidyltransferase n=1 Tax=Pseudoruegeria sp. SHC-113 TaxID=2855439 RepID=UPI0021BABD26|nr:CCA tRNA nucleotidyltransferase [Pseudoruegeria sp. SHC-113]MCT8158555.1 CCA tRNA nucleotidyltransferase [Pseudoruegeria sp. SHC-113]
MRVTGEWIDAPEAQAVMAVLTGAGYAAYFVGGCVRNTLLGAPVGDLDVCTDARPEDTHRLFTEAGFRVVPTGIDHGTVTVIAGGTPFEITTFRKDVETDGRRAVVAFADSIEDDAHRRDFTMNALYADATGAVQDPLGGLPDLKARLVRFIDDPEARIREDYLRILRFFRFHAWYGDPDQGIDADGLAACAANSAGIETLSGERLGAEMKKLLAAPDPAPSVSSMQQAGVLNAVVPGVDSKALAPLVAFEAQAGMAPDAIRRLAALGGESVAERLRLSRAEARTLEVLREAVGSGQSPAELGYRLGADMAQSVVLLRAALLEMPLEVQDLKAAQAGAEATFPVSAKDLMPALSGPALGARLKALEADWIASGFTLTRAELLA